MPYSPASFTPQRSVIVVISGGDQTVRNLNALSNRSFRAVLLGSMRYAATPMIKAAKANAPTRSGGLKRNWKGKEHAPGFLKKSIFLKAVGAKRGAGDAHMRLGPSKEAYYAIWTELGADRHPEPNNPYWRSIAGGHPGVTPKPWLRPAYESHRLGYVVRLGRYLSVRIDREVRKLGMAAYVRP